MLMEQLWNFVNGSLVECEWTASGKPVELRSSREWSAEERIANES